VLRDRAIDREPSGALALDSARQYGLIKGGPEVNVARCVEILKRGRQLGITPAPDAVEKFAQELARP
jgi:hypothetical protein